MRGSVDHELWTMRWGIKDNPHSNFSPTLTSLPKSPHPLSSKQKLHEDLFLHPPPCPATPNFNNFNQSPLYFTPPTRSSPQSVIVIAPSFSQCYRIASNHRRDLRGSSIFRRPDKVYSRFVRHWGILFTQKLYAKLLVLRPVSLVVVCLPISQMQGHNHRGVRRV